MLATCLPLPASGCTVVGVVDVAVGACVFAVIEQEDRRDRRVGGLGVTGPSVSSFFVFVLISFFTKSKENLFGVMYVC